MTIKKFTPEVQDLFIQILEDTASPKQAAAACGISRTLAFEYKAREYLKIGELRFQGLIVAIRTWKQGRSNPINTLSLALRSQQLDMKVLDSLEDDDHGQDE